VARGQIVTERSATMRALWCLEERAMNAKEATIREATRIAGWTTAEELEWLYDQALGMWLVIEVGAYLGRSTKVLACAQGVVAIDNGAGSPHGAVKGEEIRRVLEQNLADEIARGVVVILWGDSARLSMRYPRGIADMVFVDGDHDRNSVMCDILAWQRVLIPGGLLCGHDFGQKPGVGEALDELGLAVEVGPYSLWHTRSVR